MLRFRPCMDNTILYHACQIHWERQRKSANPEEGSHWGSLGCQLLDGRFAVHHVPHAEGDDLRRCLGRDLHGLVEDEEVHWQEAGSHGGMDGCLVGAIASADTACADPDDRVLAVGTGLPEVVHAVTDVLVGVRPTLLADLVADQQVQIPRFVVAEADDAAQRCRPHPADLIDEGFGDAEHVGKGGVHPDDDVGMVGTVEDIPDPYVFDHMPSLVVVLTP